MCAFMGVKKPASYLLTQLCMSSADVCLRQYLMYVHALIVRNTVRVYLL